MAIRFKNSHEWFERGKRVVPGCSQTFSKGWTQFTFGASPIFLRSGKGSRVIDVDGNEYIDYPMGLGPIILGHNYPSVTDAVMQQMQDGTTFSLPHPLEVELAEMLVDIIPCAINPFWVFTAGKLDALLGTGKFHRLYGSGRNIFKRYAAATN